MDKTTKYNFLSLNFPQSRNSLYVALHRINCVMCQNAVNPIVMWCLGLGSAAYLQYRNGRSANAAKRVLSLGGYADATGENGDCGRGLEDFIGRQDGWRVDPSQKAFGAGKTGSFLACWTEFSCCCCSKYLIRSFQKKKKTDTKKKK